MLLWDIKCVDHGSVHERTVCRWGYVCVCGLWVKWLFGTEQENKMAVIKVTIILFVRVWWSVSSFQSLFCLAYVLILCWIIHDWNLLRLNDWSFFMFHAFFIIFWLYTTVLYVQNQKTGSFPTLHLCNNVRRMTRVQLLAYMLFPS